MKFLISGGQGFVGSYMTYNLRQYGYIVKTIGKSKENDITVDLSKDYIRLEEDFDFIIHSASIVHDATHASSIQNAQIIKDINITENFLRCIENCDYKKVIFLSSISVYGVTQGFQINVKHPTEPTSGYGLSKLINEKILTASLNGQKLLILRLPLVNGPNAKGNIKKTISNLEKGRMIIFSNNPAIKSILEISDLYHFIINKSMKYCGIHQFKSYDINFNSFVESLSNKKPIKLPLFLTTIFKFIFKVLRLKKPLILIEKITFSLTIKNTV